MSRITLFKGLLLNLEGKIQPPERREYLPPEEALAELKKRTGEDFGYDAAAWREWLKRAKLR